MVLLLLLPLSWEVLRCCAELVFGLKCPYPRNLLKPSVYKRTKCIIICVLLLFQINNTAQFSSYKLNIEVINSVLNSVFRFRFSSDCDRWGFPHPQPSRGGWPETTINQVGYINNPDRPTVLCLSSRSRTSVSVE